ncbi:hypothetical protein [Roseateles sp. LYH14W]|uniref:DUF4229 domain-containing protein n=1 Tax=Pelomonas parva TaxID=3299032 RepID=A0ABW7F370_9BURK
MSFFRLLLRWLILIVGAIVGLAFFLFAVVAFVTILLLSLLTGRKPNMQFRMNRSPWAQRRPQAPADGDVVDIEAREVKAPAAPPLPLQPPPRH